jgi:hypothetical protein
VIDKLCLCVKLVCATMTIRDEHVGELMSNELC